MLATAYANEQQEPNVLWRAKSLRHLIGVSRCSFIVLTEDVAVYLDRPLIAHEVTLDLRFLNR